MTASSSLHNIRNLLHWSAKSQRAHSTLSEENLIVLRNDVASQENGSSASSNSSQKVCHQSESSNAHSTKCSSSWNVGVQNTLRISHVSLNGHVLRSQLSHYILGRCSAHVNPQLAKECTGEKHKGDVGDGVDRIREKVGDGSWRTDVVCQSTDWNGCSRGVLVGGPFSQHVHNNVASKSPEQQLGDHEKVGYESSLQNDWHVAGVKELDWVLSSCSTLFVAHYRELNTETGEINDNDKNQCSCQEIGDVRQVWTVECLLESSHLV
mmetsp:Transcript_9560/g.35440  ORF Transcript_9560/g.35440 Transcript_9560/m.35440 type:complete len:266 (-) Transcript_9560:743-1540(-)